MRWYYEGNVEVTDPETKVDSSIYIDSSGTIKDGDFEIDELTAYWEDGKERLLKAWEEYEIENWLCNNSDLEQQAYENACDSDYDRYNDR